MESEVDRLHSILYDYPLPPAHVTEAERVKVQDFSQKNWLWLAFRCYPKLKPSWTRQVMDDDRSFRYAIKNTTLQTGKKTVEAARGVIESQREQYETVTKETVLGKINPDKTCRTTISAGNLKEFAPTHILAFPITDADSFRAHQRLPVMHLVIAAYCYFDFNILHESPKPNYVKTPDGTSIWATLSVVWQKSEKQDQFTAIRTVYEFLTLQDIMVLEEFIMPSRGLADDKVGNPRRSRKHVGPWADRQDLQGKVKEFCITREILCKCMQNTFQLWQTAEYMGLDSSSFFYSFIDTIWGAGKVLPEIWYPILSEYGG